MLSFIARYLNEKRVALSQRVRNLTASVDLVESMLPKGGRVVTRILLSSSGRECFRMRATASDIKQAAKLMAERTKSCVAILEVVGIHHITGATGGSEECVPFPEGRN